MKKYAASVVYLSSNVVLAKIFVCNAELIKDSQKQLADFIKKLGVPENLAIDKKLHSIESYEEPAYIGAFATLDSGNIRADFVILYAGGPDQLVEMIVSGYKKDSETTAVIVEGLEVKRLSDC